MCIRDREYIENPDVWSMTPPKWASELSAKGYVGRCAIDFYDDIFGDDLKYPECQRTM